MTEGTADVLRVEQIDDIGLITLASPPVNALSRPLREALIAATDDLNATPSIRVIVIISDLHVFSAGADMREFAQPPRRPYLQDVCANLEASRKPVVTVLHGAAFGGALGIAMASHARVALPGTRLGLTEVHAGVLPGAGGTQRTPRLAGVRTAIDLIVSGRTFDAAEGLATGLLDRMMDGTPRRVALRAARDVLSGALPTRRTGQIRVRVDPAVIAAAAQALAADPAATAAQRKAVEAISHAGLPLADGILHERAMVLELLKGPERQGLAHAHSVERLSRQLPDALAPARLPDAAAIIGHDAAATGFAAALLQAGLQVTLLCPAGVPQDDLRKRVLTQARVLDSQRPVPRQSPGDLGSALRVTDDLAALTGESLVLMAQDAAIDPALRARLSGLVPPDAVLGVITLGEDPAILPEMDDVLAGLVGLHAVARPGPSHLLEVQHTGYTPPGFVATAFALAVAMRMAVVRSQNKPVSVAILDHAQHLVRHLVQAGVPARRLQQLIADSGLGPAEPVVARWIAHGPALASGGAAGSLGDADILDRYRAALLLAACRALESDPALRPADIDTALLGHGMRRTLGGLFHIADRLGPAPLMAQIAGWSDEDPDLWHIPDLLTRLASRNGSFADLNKEPTRGS